MKIERNKIYFMAISFILTFLTEIWLNWSTTYDSQLTLIFVTSLYYFLYFCFAIEAIYNIAKKLKPKYNIDMLCISICAIAIMFSLCASFCRKIENELALVATFIIPFIMLFIKGAWKKIY